jgi:hypothetical protein
MTDRDTVTGTVVYEMHKKIRKKLVLKLKRRDLYYRPALSIT